MPLRNILLIPIRFQDVGHIKFCNGHFISIDIAAINPSSLFHGNLHYFTVYIKDSLNCKVMSFNQVHCIQSITSDNVLLFVDGMTEKYTNKSVFYRICLSKVDLSKSNVDVIT